MRVDSVRRLVAEAKQECAEYPDSSLDIYIGTTGRFLMMNAEFVEDLQVVNDELRWDGGSVSCELIMGMVFGQ